MLTTKTCKHCSMIIPQDARICPHCRKTLSWWSPKIIAVVIGIILLFMIIGHSMTGEEGARKTAAPVKTPKEIAAEARKAQLRPQFSGWDGSHRGLEEYIKDHMNDPDSYKHVETEYWDRKDYLIVKTIFRGKNAFGGTVTNTIMAKVDMNGNVIEIIKAEQ